MNRRRTKLWENFRWGGGKISKLMLNGICSLDKIGVNESRTGEIWSLKLRVEKWNSYFGQETYGVSKRCRENDGQAVNHWNQEVSMKGTHLKKSVRTSLTGPRSSQQAVLCWFSGGGCWLDGEDDATPVCSSLSANNHERRRSSGDFEELFFSIKNINIIIIIFVSLS